MRPSFGTRCWLLYCGFPACDCSALPALLLVLVLVLLGVISLLLICNWATAE
jgi:hypothetical protein